MSDQITNNPEALRLFFTEDIFLVDAAESSTGSFNAEHTSVAGAGQDSTTENTPNRGNEQAVAPRAVVPVKTAEMPSIADLPSVANVSFTTDPASIADTPSTDDIPLIAEKASIANTPSIAYTPSIADAPVASPKMTSTSPDISIPAIGNQATDPVSNNQPPIIPTIDNPVHRTQPEVPATQTFSYVGANERNILILVNDEKFPVSTQQGRELLGNILKAIGLSRNDCALVNYTDCKGADFEQFKDFFQPKYVFAFGVTPEQLKISTTAYNSIVSLGTCKLIFSSNLDALSDDAATKKLLWGSLKQIEL